MAMNSYPIGICGIAGDVRSGVMQAVNVCENDHPGHPCTNIVLTISNVLNIGWVLYTLQRTRLV